jgi:hypothetical protein
MLVKWYQRRKNKMGVGTIVAGILIAFFIIVVFIGIVIFATTGIQ